MKWTLRDRVKRYLSIEYSSSDVKTFSLVLDCNVWTECENLLIFLECWMVVKACDHNLTRKFVLGAWTVFKVIHWLTTNEDTWELLERKCWSGLIFGRELILDYLCNLCYVFLQRDGLEVFHKGYLMVFDDLLKCMNWFRVFLMKLSEVHPQLRLEW